jgi:predicted nucleotidyltransferase
MDAIKKEIQERLQQVEEDEKVFIFYACESGSRAWGFPSVDSDYDIRFLYIHPKKWYLSIDEKRDVIERRISDLIDLSGWDIRKALRLFRKSNPPLLEWLNSPIVYQQRLHIVDKIKALMPDYYSPKSCLYHYRHMAEGNFREYLKGEIVWIKKYFYVLRPILACKWIEAGYGVVPMEFVTLVDRMVESEELKTAIYKLLRRKEDGQELDREPRIPIISEFIEKELDMLGKKKFDGDSFRPNTEKLDDLFRLALEEIWENINQPL